MKKQILGNVYFDDDETYHNVYVECPKDEAPQIYLTFPVKALRLCQLRVCVWVNDPDLLIRIGEELKERISKLQTERQQQPQNKGGKMVEVKEVQVPRTVEIHCLCGERTTLYLVGGQYQNLYQGECQKCSRKWSLEEQSELLMEL